MELKTVLENLPDEMEVILQRDPEGNGYSHVHGADPEAVVVVENGRVETVYNLHHSAEDNEMPEPAWNAIKLMPKSLIIYPTL